jgi:hypothetical protein
LIDGQLAGAAGFDADLGDARARQLKPPEEGVESLAVLEVPRVRAALVPAGGLEHNRDHAVLRLLDAERGIEYGPVEINDLHRGSPPRRGVAPL